MKAIKQPLLSEAEIEDRLRRLPLLKNFWGNATPLLLIRGRPTLEDPVYEIQLAFDLGDRLETWRWIWVDARNGRIFRQFPP